MRPVLLERVQRQWVGHCCGALALVAFAVYLLLSSSEVSYSGTLVCVLLCGVFLPGLQEIGPGDRVWDAALPVDPARYARVRLVCGVAGAAFLLAVGVGLYAVLFRSPEHPGWYSPALFCWGLTCYLLASAALLSPLIGVVAYPGLFFLGVVLVMVAREEAAEFRPMGVLEVLARTALPLAVAGATAYVAARFPVRTEPALPEARGPTGSASPARASGIRCAAAGSSIPRREPARALPARPAPLRVRRGGLARPPAALKVFRRQMRVLLRFTILPALTVFVFAWIVLMQLLAGPDQAGESQTVGYFVEFLGFRYACAFIALSWAVVVWLAERGAERRWNDTLPVDTAKRRILHVVAGTAWLLLVLQVAVVAPLVAAVAAGTLSSAADVPAWLWVGIPCRTLTLYLGCIFVLFTARPAVEASSALVPFIITRDLPGFLAWPIAFIAIVTGILAIPYGLMILSIHLLGTLTLALAGDTSPDGWNHATSALWLVLFAAAAAGAIALEDRLHQRDRLPTLQEVRGFFHRWAGAGSGPSLGRHAAQ
ncbi:MAG TPA: hypothetical protein VF006_03855 [Longimicrobium sp.]